MCTKQGRVTAATDVDHIEPHKGDEQKFWNQDNWQSLCGPHHDKDKRQEERSGYSTGFGSDGKPLDPKQPCWGNTAKRGIK